MNIDYLIASEIKRLSEKYQKDYLDVKDVM